MYIYGVQEPGISGSQVLACYTVLLDKVKSLHLPANLIVLFTEDSC